MSAPGLIIGLKNRVTAQLKVDLLSGQAPGYAFFEQCPSHSKLAVEIDRLIFYH